MPTTILHKESLIPGRTSKLVLDAPQIAATAKPGHFVMLRVNEQGERFPLTIADTDPEKGTITIVYGQIDDDAGSAFRRRQYS